MGFPLQVVNSPAVVQQGGASLLSFKPGEMKALEEKKEGLGACAP